MIEIKKTGSPETGDLCEALAQLREQSISTGVPTDRRRIAEDLFADIIWKDETTGFITCPGHEAHTGKNGPRDCRLKIDGVATIHCVHASCVGEVQEANAVLRMAIESSSPVVATADRKKAITAARAKAARNESIRIRSKNALPGILKAYSWTYEQIVKDSPDQIEPADRVGMVQAFLASFENDDVVWIGDVSETGRPHHVHNFKTRAQWLAGDLPSGPYTCPSCFAPSAYSRSKDNVVVQRYLVVESDTLSKDAVGAIFRWLDRAVELPLRIVVDTAGKSLHGWFDYPPAGVLEELKLVLPAMGCDPKMFGSSQPCRLPGGLRDGRIQRFIYTKGGVL